MSSFRSSDPGFPPVVLLAGSESTLREDAIAGLRARVLRDGPVDFNFDRIDLAQATGMGQRAIAAARTLPMLGSGRLVIVRGLDDRKAKPFCESLLLDYLEDPVSSTCLVLDAEKIDRRMKWVKRVEQVGEVRRCDAPTRPAELRAWVEQRLRARELSAGPGAAAALVEAIGPDLDRLASEIEKLALFALDARAVSADDVAALCGEVRQRVIYELTDAVGQRDRSQALRLLDRLLGQGEAPLAVLGALGNHFRRLIRAIECRPLSPAEVQKRLSVHPFAAKKLVEQARRFDARRLRRCLDIVRRTDDAVKGAVPLSPRTSLEQLVIAVCG